MRFETMAGAALSIACALGAAGGAKAAVTEIDIGLNPLYQQTGATTVVATGGFFAARAFLDSASDFDGGTLTYPGAGSPVALTPAPGATLAFSDSAGTLADLNAAYPFGTYAFQVTNSGTAASQSASLSYTVAAASLSVPMLTAASFNQLQGLDAASGFTFDFNAFAQNPDANLAFVFLDVTDSLGNDVFFRGLSPSTTSIFMPGGTLGAGQSYNFDLNFDSRITGADGGVATTIFFDTHTLGAFSTAAAAVPEASTWAMMIVGLGGVGAALRRRWAKGQTA
ncbi:PEPxxWA-CTERM sorting domain-containing protein [Phenylobacterium sp.]|uniref:PEPxxWA-CTERM sorting domain-containing protein n=1 Tax=Phenylobacterium sp. TaxID=1871053 RepID=UPI0025FD7132|nr:PEPxxWA-CTERM sorting domain-containing protein [Phenylobacterium sp.]